MIEDRKTYRVDRDIKCCWNCKHVFSRFNLSLSCNNHEEWVKEASVIPVGVCDSYEKKEEQEKMAKEVEK
jgi:hypothetical protein